MRAPPSLYKYFGPDRVDFLKNPHVRYSPLGAFNDPFEGRPSVTSIMNQAELKDSINQILKEEVQKEYQRLPREYQAQLPFSAYQKLFQKLVGTSMPKALQQVDSLTKPFLGMLNRTFDANVGAFCLSEVRDSLLMWAHYASSHTGFVIEFDSENSHFNAKRTEQDEFCFLRPVDYRKERPRGTLLESIEGLFTVKSSEWEYEREWRILRPLDQAEQIIPAEPFAIHLYRVPAAAIKSVIVGARATELTKAAIFAAAEKYKNLPVYRAVPCEQTFGLTFENAA
jgi:hypothetical protein